MSNQSILKTLSEINDAISSIQEEYLGFPTSWKMDSKDVFPSWGAPYQEFLERKCKSKMTEKEALKEAEFYGADKKIIAKISAVRYRIKTEISDQEYKEYLLSQIPFEPLFKHVY